MRYFTTLILLIHVYNLLNAQIYVNRNFTGIVNRDSISALTFLPKTSFNSEVNRCTFSAHNTFQWDIKFIGNFILVQWNNSSLKFNLAQELNASTDNPIRFNPKGNVWNEEIVLEKYYKDLDVNFSLFHRCKHNIDNSGLTDYTGLNEQISQRTLVLSGIFAGVASKSNYINQLFFITYSANVEYYLYKEDFRYPYTNQSGNWEDFLFSILLSVKPEYYSSAKTGIYMLGWINPVYFKNDQVKTNYHLETGFFVKGKFDRVYFFIAREYWHDDVSQPFPSIAQMNYLGIRLGY